MVKHVRTLRPVLETRSQTIILLVVGRCYKCRASCQSGGTHVWSRLYLSQGQMFSFKASVAGYTMLVPCYFVLQYLFSALTPMDYINILEWNSIFIGCQWPEIPCRYSQLNLTHPLELPLSWFLLLPTVLDGGLPTAYRLYNALQ